MTDKKRSSHMSKQQVMGGSLLCCLIGRIGLELICSRISNDLIAGSSGL